MYKGENLKIDLSKNDIDYLLSPISIRETTKKIWDRAVQGETHFNINEDKIPGCADYVLSVIKENYPNYDIPFHSRWGHFKAAGRDREKELEEKIVTKDPLEVARIKLDLVICSVLLDAGAGAHWSYTEGESKITRSEGLAVASYYMFLEGKFSHNGSLSASGEGLKKLTENDLIEAFQVSEANPLIGVSGRVSLLNKLGETILAHPKMFPNQRPSGLLDYLVSTHGKSFKVKDVLHAVLIGLGPIWPGRIIAEEMNLGDVWHYSPFGKEINKNTVVCFHKLSQWLTYSLVTPMVDAGLEVTGAEELTGLSEYRNGGLFLDYGVLQLKDETLFTKAHLPSSDLILEWRALTLQLLDRVANIIQHKLNKPVEDFPLAKVLEGGTWWAGRKIAKEKRKDGSAPIRLDSDGTVF